MQISAAVVGSGRRACKRTSSMAILLGGVLSSQLVFLLDLLGTSRCKLRNWGRVARILRHVLLYINRGTPL